jgi:hypothetical protein
VICAASFRYIGTVDWFALSRLKSRRFCIVSKLALRSNAVGVGQPARYVAVDGRSSSRPFRAISASQPAAVLDPLSPSVDLGVGQPCSDPVEPLSDVRSTDARSAGIDRPAGVSRSFQVSLYKVEPSEAVLACNLFSNDDWRAALRDEPMEGWP